MLGQVEIHSFFKAQHREKTIGIEKSSISRVLIRGVVHGLGGSFNKPRATE